MENNKLRYLVRALNEEIDNAKIKHVQLLIRSYENKPVLKFVNLDNEVYKSKINEITNRYCESIYLIKETKTTQTYAI